MLSHGLEVVEGLEGLLNTFMVADMHVVRRA